MCVASLEQLPGLDEGARDTINLDHPRRRRVFSRAPSGVGPAGRRVICGGGSVPSRSEQGGPDVLEPVAGVAGSEDDGPQARGPVAGSR